MQKQKVLQFLMGLIETYEQTMIQILMISPSPRINKAYSMLVERESQRTVNNTTTTGDGNELAALLSGKNDAYQNYQSPKRNCNVQCNYYMIKGHAKEGCYKLIGYPAGFKGKRKMNMNTAYNACAENANPNIGTGQLDGCNKGEMTRAP